MAGLGVSPTTVRLAVAELVREGRVETVSGSGTFIAHRPDTRASLASRGDRSWQTVALGPHHTDVDLLSEVLDPLRSHSGIDTIDLAGGYPDVSLQPTSLVARSMAATGRRPGTFDRAPVEGIGPLRDWFGERVGPGRDRDVLITPGGQAALLLVFRSLGLPGDTVLMESPTYVGAIAAARAAGLTPVPVPVDRAGLLPDELAEAARRTGATLAYLQPRFHNPTGITLAGERRAGVMALADARGLVLVEDDWLIDLDDPVTARPPLAADDPDGHVIHVHSLTKSVAPGLRIAGVSAVGAVARRLRSGRAVEDFFVSPILQEIALEVVTSPSWPRHLRRLGSLLAHRQAVLRAALSRAGGWSGEQTGGPLHLWLEPPPGVDPDELRSAALRHGVLIVSGTQWHAGDPPAPRVRISNAAGPPAAIDEGVRRLAAAVDGIIG